MNKAYHDGKLGRITFIRINPHDPSVVYAGSRYAGLIKIENLADDSSHAGNVPIAMEYEVEVSSVDQTMGVEYSDVTSLAIHPTSSSTLFAGMAGIFKSVDAGRTWKQVFKRPPVETIVMDPKNPNVMFAAGGAAGFYRTADGGETWEEAGAELRSVYCLIVDTTIPSTMYAGAYGALYKTTDSGKSWVELQRAAAPSLAIDPTNSNIIIAATRTVGEDFKGGVLKSEDGGKAWKNTTPSGQYCDFWACAIDPKNPARMYAGECSGGGVLRSTDHGSTWTAINDGLEDRNVYSIAVDPENPNIIWAGTERGGVFRMVQSERTDLQDGPVATSREISVERKIPVVGGDTAGPSKTIYVDSVPPGAEVYLHPKEGGLGAKIGVTPLELAAAAYEDKRFAVVMSARTYHEQVASIPAMRAWESDNYFSPDRERGYWTSSSLFSGLEDTETTIIMQVADSNDVVAMGPVYELEWPDNDRICALFLPEEVSPRSFFAVMPARGTFCGPPNERIQRRVMKDCLLSEDQARIALEVLERCGKYVALSQAADGVDVYRLECAREQADAMVITKMPRLRKNEGRRL